MPICQKCQASYDEWQHFCLQCGAYLKARPPQFVHCPKCGKGVETVPPFDLEFESTIQETGAHPGVARSRRWLGGVVAVLLGLGLILVWHQTRRASPNLAQMVESPVHRQEMAKPAVPLEEREIKAPATANSSLQAEVQGLLANIKEANLKKNILLFMNTLTGDYPQLDKKRQEVIKTWKKFDFKEMAYTIDRLQEVGRDKAIAEVKWTSTSQNLKTKDWRTGESHYRLWLSNDLGHWRIEKIEQMQH